MHRRPLLAASLLLASAACGQSAQPSIAPGALILKQVKATAVTYKGQPATRIDDAAPVDAGDAGRLAIIHGTSSTDGTIDLDLAGDTAPNADPVFRGFVGLAFRVADNHFECFYLRPKNGHSPDAVQRTHAAQYISMPGYPWQKLRSETPGKYEAAADINPGDWIHVHIEVDGGSAKLFVNHATTPTLVVSDLKQPVTPGALALWIGPGTIAHFANLTYTSAPKR